MSRKNRKPNSVRRQDEEPQPNRRAGRAAKRGYPTEDLYKVQPDVTFYEPVQKEIKPFIPWGAKQKEYTNSIHTNTITFGIGSSGTGKTYVVGAIAAEMLRDGLIDRIIITRPTVEAGEKLGALPGELMDKFKPFIDPFLDVLNERLGKSQVGMFMKNGKIQAKPMSFMRGTNHKDAFVILDEAQNATPTQMELFLTRTGENCKVVVDGDIKQKDIYGTSGLFDAVSKLQNINGVGVVEFEIADCVRSGICKEILRAYS